MKIGQYLVKLWARVRCLVFLTHSVVRIHVQPATRAVGNVHHVLGFIVHVFVYLRDEQSDTFIVEMHLLDTCMR